MQGCGYGPYCKFAMLNKASLVEPWDYRVNLGTSNATFRPNTLHQFDMRPLE